MTAEKRMEAITKLYQAWRLLSEVAGLGEQYLLCDDSGRQEKLFPISEQLAWYIESIGAVDGLSFSRIEDNKTYIDMELVEKYLMSEQEKPIEVTSVEEPVELDTNKKSTQGSLIDTVSKPKLPTGGSAVKNLKSYLKGDRKY